MRKRVFAALLALCLAAALLPGAALAVEPAKTTNLGLNEYWQWRNWSFPVTSYLCENSSGGLTRVEHAEEMGYNIWTSKEGWHYVVTQKEQMIVEEYDSKYQITKKLSIPMELKLWGGFYAGRDYNFMIFGAENLAAKDDVEVIRVVKYSKDWKRLGAASLYGANTTVPFDAGSLRCAEYGGMLYVRTCHEMYDGHQANLTFSVRESDMVITDSFYGVMNNDYGYVSHSFNQFILVDQQQRIVAVDHGDAYSRGISLMVYPTPAGGDTFVPDDPWHSGVTTVMIQTFPGYTGDNYTGAQVGGFAETETGYLVAYSYNGYNSGSNAAVYLAYVAKDTLNCTVRKLSTADCGNPVLAPAGLKSGYVLWMNKNTGKLEYTAYNSVGVTGEVKTSEAKLSDCQPILHNGELVWYVTDNSTPTFYTLNENGALRGVFKDVSGTAYYYDAVAWAIKKGITSGTSLTTFSPDSPCTRAQIMQFLWRAAGSPEPTNKKNPFTDVKSGDYYYDAVLWAVENGITSGTSATTFSPNSPCTRAQSMTFIYNYAKRPAPKNTASRFTDVKTGAYYYDAVLWAVENGITAGTSATTFSPDNTCTRAQIVTFLYIAIAN